VSGRTHAHRWARLSRQSGEALTADWRGPIRLSGETILVAIPMMALIGTVLDTGLQSLRLVPLALDPQWSRESAESLRWSPITHTRPAGMVTGPKFAFPSGASM
jgi:hypothetical protein